MSGRNLDSALRFRRLLDQPELCPKIALVALDFGPQESVNAAVTRPKAGACVRLGSHSGLCPVKALDRPASDHRGNNDKIQEAHHEGRIH
jgi:hypothetical protein